MVKKLDWTTTLAYRIVINCTAAESVLKLVSTFRLACSSHRQETEEVRVISYYLYSGNCLYLSNSACHSSLVLGGFIPLIRCQSVIDNPDSVSLQGGYGRGVGWAW